MSNDQVQVSNYQFTAEKGSEFVICNTTGKPHATQAGLARILEMPESTLRGKLTARGLNNESNGFQPISPVEGLVKFNESNKISPAKLYSAKDVFHLALDYNPKVADLMAEGGANMYLLHLAGYKAKLVEPTPAPKQTLNMAELAQAYLDERKERMQLQAQIEEDADDTNHGKMVRHSSNFRDIGAFGKTLVPVLGRNKTFKLLHELGFTMQKFPLPYQSHINNGNFEVIQVVCDNGKGGYGTFSKTFITGKDELAVTKAIAQANAKELAIVQLEDSLPNLI